MDVDGDFAESLGEVGVDVGATTVSDEGFTPVGFRFIERAFCRRVDFTGFVDDFLKV